jgi:hypothetical protein
MILAKPVIENKYWILKENDQKVGVVEAVPGGFNVRLYNDESQYKTIRTIKNKTRIEFQPAPERKKPKAGYDVNGFATDATPYNAVYDVQKRLPMFTKKRKSKSWFAAGYYQIEVNGVWTTEFCPKLILLQRYPYMGPAHSPEGFIFQ